MNPLFRKLGPEYAEAAERARTLYEREHAALFEGLPAIAAPPIPPQVYHCLPWLFADLFPELPDDRLCTVAAAGLLYFGHVLVLDRALDGDAVATGADLLRGSLQHERALTLLFPHLPHDTTAWRELSRYAREYADAVLLEREHTGRVAPFPWERFARIAAGKAAIAKASPAMLACMAGRAESIAEVDAMIGPFNVALQVQDDLEDWRADYRAGRHSYVLTRALDALGGAADGPDRPDEEEVGHALFYSSAALDALAGGIEGCDRSLERARALGASRWARYAGLFRDRLAEVEAGFRRLRDRGLASAARPARPDTDAALGRLTDALLAQHRAGYPEARHTMAFPHRLGFTGETEVHHGDVFPRAVIGWYWALAEAAGAPLPPGIVDENLDVLHTLRPAGERGGWSYFPTLPELPPDSDDLAQVIHALAARPADRWAARVEDAVRLVLERPARADGGVETWIIDEEAPPERRERYRRAVARHWGRGVDPEVVANFHAALSRVDAERYRAVAARGASFVAAAQSPEGSWNSTWYVGPYYGTYVCCRLLRETGVEAAARERAAGFLRRTQRADGGWGAGRSSDALSTALGLLALTEAWDGSDATVRAGTGALRHLLLVQREDGLWPAADFIRMDLNRAVADAAPHFVTYRSATITAAFAGAALRRGIAALEAS